MIILLDVDLILELLLPRVGLAERADQRYRQFWEVLRNSQIEAYITQNGFVKISDFFRRRNNSDASVVICEIQDIFTICSVDNGILEKACAFHQIRDLESAIEVVCALEMEAIAIISHNTEIFAGANFQILSVEEFLTYWRMNFAIQLVSLRNWFINTFDSGWRPAEEFSNYRRTSMKSVVNQPENSVTREKEVELEGNGIIIRLRLIVRVVTSNEQFFVFLLIRPIIGTSYLPQGLQVIILDQDEVIHEIIEVENDNDLLEVTLEASSEEIFGIRFGLYQISFTEYFIV